MGPLLMSVALLAVVLGARCEEGGGGDGALLERLVTPHALQLPPSAAQRAVPPPSPPPSPPAP